MKAIMMWSRTDSSILVYGVCLLFAVFVYAQGEDQEYTIALGAYRDGFYDIALPQFEAYIKAHPEGEYAANSHFYIGKILQSQSKHARAVEHFRKALERKPGEDLASYVMFELGISSFKMADYAASKDAFSNIISRYGSTNIAQDAMYWLAETYSAEEKYEFAISAYDDLVKKFPAGQYTAYALYSAGWCYMKLGKYDSAKSYLNRVLNQHPKAEVARESSFYLAKAYFLTEDYENTEKMLNSIKPYPAKFKEELLFIEASTYFQLKRYDESLKAIDGYLAQYPKGRFGEELFFIKGWIAYEMKRWKHAVSQFRIFLERYPTSLRKGKAEYLSAKCYQQLGDINASLAAYQSARDCIELPKQVKCDILFSHAILLMQLERAEEYAKILRQFIHSCPQSVHLGYAYYAIGKSLYIRKKYEQAIPYFTQAEQVSGEYADDAIFEIGRCHFAQGDYFSALLSFQKYLLAYPRGEMAQQARLLSAETMYQGGRYAEAIDTFSSILPSQRNSENTPFIVARMFDSYARLSDLDAMIGLLKRYQPVLAGTSYLMPMITTVFNQLITGKEPQATRSFLYDFILPYADADRKADLHLLYLKQLDDLQLYKLLLEELDRFLETYPPKSFNYEMVFYLLGRLEKHVEPQAVISLLQGLMDKRHPLSARELATFYKAKYIYYLGDKPESLRLFYRIIARDPTRQLAQKCLLFLGHLEYIEENYAEAASFLNMCVREKVLPEARLYLAISYNNMNRHDLAVGILEDIIDQGAENDLITQKALIELAGIYEQKQDWEKALDTYDRYLERFPAGGYLEFARKRFDMLSKYKINSNPDEYNETKNEVSPEGK